MGLGDLGAFAVAIQAKAQMCLKCSGKGQHLQEGRGQPLLHLIPQACPFSPKPVLLPLLVSGTQYKEWLSLPGCPEDKVLFFGGLAFRSQLGYPWEGSWEPQLQWSDNGEDI